MAAKTQLLEITKTGNTIYVSGVKNGGQCASPNCSRPISLDSLMPIRKFTCRTTLLYADLK